MKKSRAEVGDNFPKFLIEEYEKKNEKNGEFFKREPGDFTPVHPKFIDAEIKEFDYLDTMTAIPYNVALEYTFNSIFGNVREMLMDQYDMDSYDPWKSQLVVTEQMARDMLVAANYILLEHFDEKMEKVMDNPFIDVIGSMSDKYSEYKYRLKFPNDEEPFVEEEDNTCVIESLKTILSAFLTTDKPDEYVLVAEVWG
jgi:hypothetical protein